LIDDLIKKTSAPFEILVWLNLGDEDHERFLLEKTKAGHPVKIIGKTPENIGMVAYYELFKKARYELVVQIDDDVVLVSRRIAEYAAEVFRKFRNVRQLVADVWQDEYTTGARPPMSAYKAFNKEYGLYEGPIDGWFSVYHRSILSLIPKVSHSKYFPLGGLTRNRLRRNRLQGLLCTQFKVFHVIGPEYASFYNMLNFEIEKYKRLGRFDIVEWYERSSQNLPPVETLHKNVERIRENLDRE
jgi:hypothetical protein